MRDGEWYLGYYSYDDHHGAALTFGRQDSGIYCLAEPEIKFSDPEVGDQALPGEDGIRLGRDYQRQAIVTFELGVDTVDAPVDRHWPAPYWMVAGSRVGDWTDSPIALPELKKKGTPWEWNQEGVSMLRQVWRGDSIRLKPTRVAWLLHKSAGRTRRLYGRPRKFEIAHSRLTRQGYTPVLAEFVALDDRFYDDEEQLAEMWDLYRRGRKPVPGRPSWPGMPEWLFQPTKKSVVLRVAGRLPTYPVIVINGPCKDPKVSLTRGWSVQLATTLKKDEFVTIDARPWARTVIRTTASGTTSSVADKLTRASARLGAMSLPPGLWAATLSYTRSSDVFNSGPRVQIKWRNAHAWW
ncbi:hypothetical protein ACWGH2_42385 [Streptomyces sp. NPDC054871]